jgi:hypothetical protein
MSDNMFMFIFALVYVASWIVIAHFECKEGRRQTFHDHDGPVTDLEAILRPRH